MTLAPDDGRRGPAVVGRPIHAGWSRSAAAGRASLRPRLRLQTR
jgi:hypothetical protein